MIATDLVPGGAPLPAVPGLNAAQIQVLNDLWIDTAQELVGIYGTNEETRGRLALALEIDRSSLDSIVNTAQRMSLGTRSVMSEAFEFEALTGNYPLGALLEDPAATAARMTNLPSYVSKLRLPLPGSHSLLGELPPLRSQGKRPTCVAYAVLSVREQLEMACGAPRDLDLSEQFVYWWCKERDGLPTRNGTYLSLGMRCLNQVGAPFEALWPYEPTPVAELGVGAPPPDAADGDAGFCIAETQEFNRTDIDGMKACLLEGRSIAFSLPVYNSWFKSSAMARWGKITMPLPGEPMREGHAMAIAGYNDDARAPGGGYFLLRNSWQPWAWDGVWQPGYGYMPYAYVSRHASVVLSARRHENGRLSVRGKESAGVFYESPDVWLRQAPDGGTEAQAARSERENSLYVRITNSGPTYCYGLTGEVLFQQPGSTAWERAAFFAQEWLPPGETVVGPLAWPPPASVYFPLAVRLG